MLNVNNFIAFEFTLCKFIFCNFKSLIKLSDQLKIKYPTHYFIKEGLVETLFQRYYT